MGKRDVTIKRTFDAVTGVVKFDAGTLGKREYPLFDLAGPIKTQMMGHGGLDKLGDGLAMKAGSTVDQKFAGSDGIWQNLLAGNWESKREAMTPEQKFELMRANVEAAWITLAKGRDAAGFAKYVAETATKNSAALKPLVVTAAMVVDGLSKNPKIIGAIAAMQKPTGVALTFTDI